MDERKRYSHFIRKDKCSPSFSQQFDKRPNSFLSTLFLLKGNWNKLSNGFSVKMVFVDVDIKLWF